MTTPNQSDMPNHDVEGHPDNPFGMNFTTPNQSTPTPRTDESTSICGSISQQEHVSADLARTLERELTEANAKYAKLVADYSHAVLGESEQQELDRVKAELTEARQQLVAKGEEIEQLKRDYTTIEAIARGCTCPAKDMEIEMLAGKLKEEHAIAVERLLDAHRYCNQLTQMTQQRDAYKQCAEGLGEAIKFTFQIEIARYNGLSVSVIDKLSEALAKLKNLKGEA